MRDGESDGDGDETTSADGDDTANADGDNTANAEGNVNANDEDWLMALEAMGRLTAPIADAIVSTHGDRGVRAIEAVSEHRVKQYRDFTVVVGYDDEYVIEDGGCTCKDSSYNLDSEDPEQRCWHVLAADIADALGEVDYHDMWYSDVHEFL